jgi:hypothetical protein
MPATKTPMNLATQKEAPLRLPGVTEHYLRYLTQYNIRNFRDRCVLKVSTRRLLFDLDAIQEWLEEGRGLPSNTSGEEREALA